MTNLPKTPLPAKPAAAKAAPLAVLRDPAVDEIIALAGKLIATMTQETALLAEMKVGEMAAGQAEKDRQARAFETKLRALAEDKALVGSIAPALREELQAVMAQFRAAMTANERALRAAKDANERVVKAIVEAAQAQTAPRHAYSAAGTLGAPATGDRAAAPFTLDQRL